MLRQSFLLIPQAQHKQIVDEMRAQFEMEVWLIQYNQQYNKLYFDSNLR